MATKDAQDVTLRMSRRFAAPPERVFEAWTSAEALKRWAPPGDLVAPEVDVDLRVGGRYRIQMMMPEGRLIEVAGVYREIDPPRRLVYTWKWEHSGDAPDTIVSVEFRPAEGGTEVLLTQTGFEDAAARDRHDHGWTGSFEKLAREVSN
jgi:uncharacterized protein YndB with AHSA1/START domain